MPRGIKWTLRTLNGLQDIFSQYGALEHKTVIACLFLWHHTGESLGDLIDPLLLVLALRNTKHVLERFLVHSVLLQDALAILRHDLAAPVTVIGNAPCQAKGFVVLFVFQPQGEQEIHKRKVGAHVGGELLDVADESVACVGVFFQKDTGFRKRFVHLVVMRKSLYIAQMRIDIFRLAVATVAPEFENQLL